MKNTDKATLYASLGGLVGALLIGWGGGNFWLCLIIGFVAAAIVRQEIIKQMARENVANLQNK
jgi:hypothetical protein